MDKSYFSFFRRTGKGFSAATGFVAGAFFIVTAGIAAVPAVVDTLDRPARQSSKVLQAPFSGIASSGAKAIAVGARGAILVSRDAGASWTQVPSPVSTDLTTVRFASPNVAWAVGHDAILLRSDDAGMTWNRVLDGRSVLDLMTKHYQNLAGNGKPELEKLVVEVERAGGQSATPGVLPYPFLDVWFGNDGEGFIAGGFGFLLHTMDNGKTWEPWIERADNDRRMHIYALEQTQDGNVYLAGEQGLVRRLDRKTKQFVALDTPYKGTFFGLKATDSGLIAYGLRGNAYLTGDMGQTWKPIPLAVDSTVVGVVEPGPDRLVFVTQGGHILESTDGGNSVTDLRVPRGGELLGAALAIGNRLALAKINGVTSLQLPIR